ncbi:MAG: SDR family oxidoreductase [Pseudomonadota bacterium]
MTEPAPERRVERPLCAIVAGAAHGVGEKFARALVARGVDLLLVDHDEFALARLRQDIGGLTMHCDILDERCVRSIFDSAEECFGSLDLLINAAGTGYVRTLSVMRLSREFSRRPRAPKAFIINLAATPDADDGPFTYAGSETAFNRLSEGLARAIQGPDLRVLTLDRVDSQAAIDDLIEQVLRELGSTRPAANVVRQSRAAS